MTGAARAAAPLALHGVSKRFGAVTAVDGLDLRVDAGRVVGLVGPNGCGKTTTLRIAAGLVPPDDGSVTVAGERQGTAAARRRCAFVPDEPSGLDELSVHEFLALHRALYGGGGDVAARATRLLGAFRLGERGRTPLGALSHGTRRLVAMVAAFALAPPLVVVDEATAALDPEAVLVLRAVLRRLAVAGRGVLVAGQDLHFAERLCDEVTLLHRGRIVAAGPLPDVLARAGAESLEGAFLALLEGHVGSEDVDAALGAL